MAIETTLAVPDLRTVDPGPRRLTARYATADGTPISGAAVTAAGAASSLPLAMTEEAAGTYGAVVDIPPDVDGTRSIVQVAARKTGCATAHAATSVFSADPAAARGRAALVARRLHPDRQPVGPSARPGAVPV